MGLITETVKAKWNTKNKKWYETKGFVFTKYKDDFIVKVEDLSSGSNLRVEVKCDGEDCKDPYLKPMTWNNYIVHLKENGKYYCHSCCAKLFSGEKQTKTKLKNGKSFEKWCIENNHQDVLDRWDYELNNLKPNEMTYSVSRKFYFKCPRGIHGSELKDLNKFVNGQEGSITCKKCNSFAQWGIDNICEDFLEKYWDYEKNVFDPWEISHGTKNKVWIKCQEKEYHESYDLGCSDFTNEIRCKYCTSKNGDVHMFDSLGNLYSKSIIFWSAKNVKSPYEFTPNSHQEVYWQCPDKKHKDFKRSINSSKRYNFRCPECQYSQGEESISNYLINNLWTKVSQKEFEKLLDIINNKYYIPQKEFEGLVGVNYGSLSYDFYIPKLNLLIEYQGEQHERYILGFHKSIEDFEKQQEHDKRKKEYAGEKKIKLLEIWYWDFDNIEEILTKELNL